MAVPHPGGESALAGIRILDLSDELAAYAGRLLTDLGAEVVRVEPPGGAPTRRVRPLVARGDGPEVSMFDRFTGAGKRSVTLDLDSSEGRELLGRLLPTIDVVIESPHPRLEGLGFDADALRVLQERLARVVVTPFGIDHLPAWEPVDDLVVMADGGLLHLGGYPDVGPVVAYGGQSRMAASIFAAVAAVTAVLHVELTGEGGVYDVSAQECVAQALEDSAATYSLTGRVRERQGDRPREAGTGLYACRDGFVSMVAGRLGTARAWAALVDWMTADGGPETAVLRDAHWGEFRYRQSDEAVDAFQRIFEAFAATYDKADLYREAQARKIALSPVSTIEDLMANEQLAARGFFVRVADPDLGELTYPRPPYRLSRTPASGPQPTVPAGQDTTAVLIGELGVTEDEYRGLVERGIV